LSADATNSPPSANPATPAAFENFEKPLFALFVEATADSSSFLNWPVEASSSTKMVFAVLARLPHSALAFDLIGQLTQSLRDLCVRQRRVELARGLNSDLDGRAVNVDTDPPQMPLTLPPSRHGSR
jgi:hypothetical protein